MGKIHGYKQHTLETCGINCLMTALDHFGKEHYIGNSEIMRKERMYYQMYGADATEGTLGAAIAYVLSGRGLEVLLVHESEDMLENRGGYFSPEIHQALLKEHEGWIERAAGAFSVRTGEPITCDILREELAREKLLIVQCLIDGNNGIHDRVMHWIVLYGFENGKFLAGDPLPQGGKIRLTEDELQEYMKTPFGGTYIAVGRKG